MKNTLKSILLVGMMVIIVISLLACSNAPAKNDITLGNDYTVNIEPMDVSSNIIGQTVCAPADFLYSFDEVEDLSEVAPIIVQGTVLRVYFDDTNARATTIFDFQINSVLRGEFEIGDTISVEEYGGYVRGNVFTEKYGQKFGAPLTENDLIAIMPVGNAPIAEEGDEYILFLDESTVVDGAYSIFGIYKGKFIVDNNNLVSRYNPDAGINTDDNSVATYTAVEEPQTVNQIISAVESTPFNEPLYAERFGTHDVS